MATVNAKDNGSMGQNTEKRDPLKLTIAEVNTLRDEMNNSICEAINKFEDATGLRCGYIDVTRQADMDEMAGRMSHPSSMNPDRGKVCKVDVNTDLVD